MTKFIHENGKDYLNLVVPADNDGSLGKMKKIVEKANKKAQKYGAAPIVMTIGEPKIEVFTVPHYMADVETLDKHNGTGKAKLHVREVNISYEPIRIKGGWKVLASIEKQEDSEWNVINGNVDGIQDYKQWDLTFCDHCGTHRNRKKVIVLEDKDGNRKVVGRQCVKDYLGISVANALFAADFENYLYNLLSPVSIPSEKDDWGDDWGDDWKVDMGPSIDFLARVLSGVLESGRWTYRSAKYSDYSTSDEVMKVIADIDRGYREDYTSGKAQRIPVTIDDYVSETSDTACKEILDELKVEFPEESIATLDNSFEYDLAVMLHIGRTKKEKYFIGMMGYRMAKRYSEKKEAHRPESAYYGKVGEKISGVQVELTKAKEIESFYGVSLMVCGFFKGTGNRFVTFTSGKTDWLYDDKNSLMDEVTIAATIKDHQDRGYGKQTSLTRFRKSK